MCTRTQEKGAVTPQETDPDFPVSVQESPVEVWVSSGLLQGWVLSVAEHAWDLLKEVTMTFITSTIVSVQFSSVAQSYPTLSNRMDCSLPGSPVHGSFQARVLEWVAIAFSSGSFLVGLMATSSKRACTITRTATPRAPVPVADYC